MCSRSEYFLSLFEIIVFMAFSIFIFLNIMLQLHSRLLSLGGTCAQDLGVADERTDLAEVEPWIDLFWTKLQEQ